MKTLHDLFLDKKSVVIRGDLDVEVENGVVSEDFRLRGNVPTIQYLLEKGASRITIIGHLGRPKGKIDGSLTLRPVAEAFSKLLDMPVGFGRGSDERIRVLENLRFDSREEKNDLDFAKELAAYGDIFVNDAFSVSHREHASTVGIAGYLPSCLGLTFVKEVEELGNARNNPSRPLVLIMAGGGKEETKVPLVSGMSDFADTILLGGKLMFAQSLEGVKGVRFPVDANRFDDIGPKTVEVFRPYIEKAATIIWNGPMGRYEEKNFEYGTRAIAELVCGSGAKTILGGGDTIAALDSFGMLDDIDFVSTGGGAMLHFLAYGSVPALEVL